MGWNGSASCDGVLSVGPSPPSNVSDFDVNGSVISESASSDNCRQKDDLEASHDNGDDNDGDDDNGVIPWNADEGYGNSVEHDEGHVHLHNWTQYTEDNYVYRYIVACENHAQLSQDYFDQDKVMWCASFVDVQYHMLWVRYR